MIVSTLPPRVFLDSSQSGSGYSPDDATRNMSNCKGAADGIYVRGPILIFDAPYTVDDAPAGYVWQGYGEDISTLTGANFDCDGAVFCSFKLTGDFDDTNPTGPFRAENCQLHDVRGQFNANGCRISGTLKPVDHCILNDCDFAQDEAGASSVPVIDLTNCTTLIVTNCRGAFEVTNRNSASGTYRVYGGSGTIAFKSSCVQWAGFTVKGAWSIVERANGASAPITDLTDGRDAANEVGNANALMATSVRATYAASGAHTLATTTITATAAVSGVAGDVLTIPSTGEAIRIVSAAGSAWTVTRGAFGTIPQPIANGAEILLGLPRKDALDAINVLIAAIVSLLTTTNNGIIILDDKLNRLSDLARGIADAHGLYRGATTGSVTNVATSFNVGTDPSGVPAGAYITNLRTGEVMEVVTTSSSAFTSVIRGKAGTTAQAMNSGDQIVSYSRGIDEMLTIIAKIDTDVVPQLNDTYLNTQSLLTLPSQIFDVDSHVRALIAAESIVATTVVGSHSNSANPIALASVAGIEAGDWLTVLTQVSSKSELILVTAVNTGPSTVNVTRGAFATIPTSLANGDIVAVVRRKDIVRHVLNLFRDNATTVVNGGGDRDVTIYEEDGTTVKAKVNISADGLTRTRIV